jgi:hypothetical protein
MLADHPGWATANFAGMTFYEHTTGDVHQGGFKTILALDEKRSFLYCLIVEYAP